MKIAVACDHGAFEYKEIVKEMLTEMGHEVEDSDVMDVSLWIIRTTQDRLHRVSQMVKTIRESLSAGQESVSALPPTRLRESVVRFAVIRLVPN
mgnify:CR=1 FL=1